MLPRCLARQCPLPLYSLPAHAVVYRYVLRPLGIMFEKGRGAGWYDAALSGTAVPPSPPLLVECIMLGCLAPPCPLSLSFLPPHAIVRGLGLFLDFTFEWVGGVECMMPRRLAQPCLLSLFSLATPCCARVGLSRVCG